VPSLDGNLQNILSHYPHSVINHQSKLNLKLSVDSPEKVGIDRLVNASYAHYKYPGDIIVIDLGTATTIDYITHEGEFLGGVIAPGLKTSADNLFSKAEKLNSIAITKPDFLIGKDTNQCLQSGIYFGYLSLLEGLIDKFKKEFSRETTVIATGGLATLFSDSSLIDHFEENLTLEGMKHIDSEV